MKPLIGLTSNYVGDDKVFSKLGAGAKGQEWSAIANDYSDAIIKAGGIPVVIPISTDKEYIKEIANRLDGIIFTGGADIDPILAKQRPSSKVGNITPLRDEQELFLLDYFYKNTNKPIFGICRGIQLLAVYFGGKLIQDIPSEGYLDHSINCNYAWNVTHSVSIDKESVLYEILGKEEIFVNSYHHQAPKEINSEFKIVAKSEDNVIEAIENNNIKERFIMGIQWHPEMLHSKHSEQQDIMNYFVNTCK